MDLEFKIVENFSTENVQITLNGQEIGSYNFDEHGSEMIDEVLFVIDQIVSIIPGAKLIHEEL